MYNNVTEYFEAEYPNLVGFLSNPGDFWPRVRDNKITIRELEQTVTAIWRAGELPSMVYNACKALLLGYKKNKIARPSP